MAERRKTKGRIPEDIAEIVRERADGACEMLLHPHCVGMAQQLHHRQLRSQGGEHTVVNLIAVCRPCHARFHREVAEAQSQGWIVRSTQDPAEVPMSRRGRVVLLDSEGGFEINEEGG